MVDTLPQSCTALLSNTICITNPEDSKDLSLEELVDDLSRLGELARVDMSLAGPLRRVLVTFFDVRSAQQALCEYAALAEPFAPMAHDCRVVSVPQATFVEKVCSGRNLRSFGEVANVSIFLTHVSIEFYDMRAAQKLLLAAKGEACPVPVDMLREMFPAPQSHQPQEAPQSTPQEVPQGTPQQLLQQLLQRALQQQQQHQPQQPPHGLQMPSREVLPALQAELRAPTAGLAGLGLGAADFPRADLPQVVTPPAPGLAAPVPVVPHIGAPSSLGAPTCVAPADVLYGSQLPADGSPPGSNGSESPGGRRGSRGGRNRAPGAVHTKVAVRDFAKFDIDPDKIRRGQDPRTTCMVRNLTGVTSRKVFVAFLEYCGLSDRFTFVHMPCKEHRRVLAGFAFINFCAPEDVLKMFHSLKRGGWHEFLADDTAKTPSISYARFQGQEELVRLFSTTAVLHEQDPEKRPLFRKPTTSNTNKKMDNLSVPHMMGLALGG